MDMLNGDLLLSNEATTKGNSKKRKASDECSADESGFHFIAFMPIEDQLWKLDGLERQPMSLGMNSSSVQSYLQALILCSIGTLQGGWLDQAKPHIEARMAQAEEGQIEFAILGLVRDPLLDLIPKLAENIKSISGLTSRLDSIKPDWRDFETASVRDQSSGLLTAVDSSYEITPELIDQADIPINVGQLCESDAVQDIIIQRQQLVSEQARLRLLIRDEQQSNWSDEDRAAARRCDYGAMMQKFVGKLKVKRRSLDQKAET